MQPQLVLIKRRSLDNKNEYHTFVELYEAYIAELSTFSSRISEEEVSEEETLGIWFNPNTQIYFVLYKEKPIGFLLLGINTNKHEDSNWYIGEFYIAKKYQYQGIGKEIACELLSKQRGKYCFYVLKKNIRAMKFWEKVFSRCSYTDVTSNYACDFTPVDCVFKMYTPSEAV